MDYTPVSSRWTVFLWIWIAVVAGGAITAAAYEKVSYSTLGRLRENLLPNYDKTIRPVKWHTDVTTVEVAIKPMYIIDLDEEKQFMTMDAEFILVWKDERLKWSVRSYDNIQKTHFADHEVWQPDITIYNSHESNIDPRKSTHVLVLSDGTVIWAPPSTLKTRCPLDLTDYPKDKQKCDVVVGSWTHEGTSIDLQPYKDSLPLLEFDDSNPKWKLVDSATVKMNRYYNCCSDPFATIVFSFTLERRPPIPLQVVWGPMNACMVLTLAMFWIPPHSGKKLILGGFTLLSLVAMMTYVAVSASSQVSPWIAVSPLHSALYTVVSAIVLEVVLVINMVTVYRSRSPPDLIVRILSGTCGSVMAVYKPRTPPTELDMLELHEESARSPKNTVYQDWYMVASAMDRVLFVIFIIVMIGIRNMS